MTKRSICTPSDDVCLAHSRPLVTSTRCEDGRHWHALASRLKQRIAKFGMQLADSGEHRRRRIRLINTCIDEWARKESRR